MKGSVGIWGRGRIYINGKSCRPRVFRQSAESIIFRRSKRENGGYKEAGKERDEGKISNRRNIRIQIEKPRKIISVRTKVID